MSFAQQQPYRPPQPGQQQPGQQLGQQPGQQMPQQPQFSAPLPTAGSTKRLYPSQPQQSIVSPPPGQQYGQQSGQQFAQQPGQQYTQQPNQQFVQQPAQQSGQQYPAQPQQFQPVSPQQQQQYQQPQQYQQQQQFMQSIPLIGQMPAIQDLKTIPHPSSMPALHQQMQPIPAAIGFNRMTINACPQTYALLSKSRIPFGLVLNIYKNIDPLKETVPVLGDTDRQDPGQPVFDSPQIVRCRRCRVYINPYIQFVDTAHWRCNVCYLVNELPAFFDYNQQGTDRYSRPEVAHSCVEYIAPAEYMVRAPQPPAFVFVVDVSYLAVQSGMVHTFAKSMKECLDSIPNVNGRALVGFLTVDQVVHAYQLDSGNEEFNMMVVCDLEDVYAPSPEGLLVNLNECRAAVENFLDKLPQMFIKNTINQNCLGAAMNLASKIIGNVGGKVVVMQASLPSIGPGALKPREDPKSLGTAQENNLMQPSSSFYKSFAIECSKNQISVDMFLFGTQYLDIATLTGSIRYTAGTSYYYPGFHGNRMEDVNKFHSELYTFLARPLGLEAVLRVRASKGVRVDAFHGNFFTRSSDLLALPTISPDNAYGFQLTIDETLQSQFACFQSALLYTTSFGERRIRVCTAAVPVVTDMAELYRNIDQTCLVNLLAKMAAERVFTAKIEDARDAIKNKCVDLLGVYKCSFSQPGVSQQLMTCPSLSLLPLLCLCLIKSLALRDGSQTYSDVRVNALSLFRTLSVENSSLYIHPSLYELHKMSQEVGMPSKQGIVLPQPVTLTSERFQRNGLYLLDAFDSMFLWVGQEVPPQVIQDLFKQPSFDQVQNGKYTLLKTDGPLNTRVNNIVNKLQENLDRQFIHPQLYVIKDDNIGDPLKQMFASQLYEDRSVSGASSYVQFLSDVKDAVNKVTI